MHLNTDVKNFAFFIQKFAFFVSVTCVEGLFFSLVLYFFVYTVLLNSLGLELLK